MNTYVTRVAILLIQDIRLATMAQASSVPCNLLGCLIIGPNPCAFTIAQIKKTMPAVGATMAFTVNKCRLVNIQYTVYNVEQVNKSNTFCE